MRLFDEIEKAVVIHDGICILGANPAALHLFRYSSQIEFASRSIFDLVSEESTPLVVRRSDKLRHNPARPLPDAQYIFKRSDGSRFVGQARTRDYTWINVMMPHRYAILFWSAITYSHEAGDTGHE